MGKQKSQRRIEALRIYLERDGTCVLADIARFLNVSASLLRKWKCEDNWDEKLTNAKEELAKLPKHKGVAYGTKLALGHKCVTSTEQLRANGLKGGCPTRQAHNEVTGEHSAIYLDALTKEERFLYEGVPQDPVSVIDETIKLLTIRERRMLKNLEDVRKEKELREETMLHTVLAGKTATEARREMTKTTQPLVDKIIAIEEALTRVQGQLVTAAEKKHKMLAEREQKNEQRGNTIVFSFNRFESC